MWLLSEIKGGIECKHTERNKKCVKFQIIRRTCKHLHNKFTLFYAKKRANGEMEINNWI